MSNSPPDGTTTSIEHEKLFGDLTLKDVLKLNLADKNDVETLARAMSADFLNDAVIPIERRIAPELRGLFYGLLLGRITGSMLAACGPGVSFSVIHMLKDICMRANLDLGQPPKPTKH